MDSDLGRQTAGAHKDAGAMAELISTKAGSPRDRLLAAIVKRFGLANSPETRRMPRVWKCTFKDQKTFQMRIPVAVTP